MVSESISSHADLQALIDRPDRRMFIKLVSLESVCATSDSYELLRNLIERKKNWRCPQMDLLSLVASVALELNKIKHDLFPLVQEAANEATLEGGFLKALLPLKVSAATLVSLAEVAKKKSLVEKNVLLGEAENVGIILDDDVRTVMRGTRKFAWLGERLSGLLDLVNDVLSSPVHFPDPK